MFSNFFQAPPLALSRMENSSVFNKITPLINELHHKNSELGKSAEKKGGSSIDYLKYTVTSKLVNDIDTIISHFNSQTIQDNPQEELKDQFSLADRLLDLIFLTLTANIKILTTARNNQRKMVNHALHYAALGGAVTAAIATAPMPFLMVPTVLLGTAIASQETRKAIGLYNITPRSACILIELTSHLISINVNLAYSLRLGIEKYASIYAKLCKLAEEEDNRNNNAPEDPPSMQENPLDNQLLQQYSQAMQAYIDSFVNKVKTSDIINQLSLTNEENKLLENYIDPITEEIMDIPVLLHGRSFDLNTLIKLKISSSGARKDPFTNYEFYLREIQPDRNTANKIQATLEKIMLDKNPPRNTPQCR